MYLHVILAHSKDSAELLSPLMKKYSFILTILFIGCRENHNTFKINNLTYTYTYGDHSGRLVLSGNSPLDSGMFALLDEYGDVLDTTYGSYVVIVNGKTLTGKSTEYHTTIFTLFSDFGSGYLFDDPTIRIERLNK
jgi:hypothetical protein